MSRFTLLSILTNKKDIINRGRIYFECDDDKCLFYLSIFLDNKTIKISYDREREKNKFFIYKNNTFNHISIERLREYVLYEINLVDSTLFRNIKKSLFLDFIESWFNPAIINDVFI